MKKQDTRTLAEVIQALTNAGTLKAIINDQEQMKLYATVRARQELEPFSVQFKKIIRPPQKTAGRLFGHHVYPLVMDGATGVTTRLGGEDALRASVHGIKLVPYTPTQVAEHINWLTSIQENRQQTSGLAL